MASLHGSNKGTPEIRRRHCLSLQDKLRLLQELDEGEGRKTNLAEKFGISKSTLSSIIGSRSKIESAFRMAKFSPNRKRLRMGKYGRLEDQLLTWYKKELEKGHKVADNLMEKKAIELAKVMNCDDFCASQGWLSRFKERKGIADWSKSSDFQEHDDSDYPFKAKQLYCLPVRTSSKYSDASIAESDNCLAEFMSWTESTNWTDAVLPDLLRTYTLENIYSVTETGLYFKCLPFGMNSLRGQSCARGEHAAERLTVVIAANLDGSRKLPLFCVGKERNPRCFKGVKNFPVTYRCSHNAWMTPEFFSCWIKELDGIFTKEGKKVAMLVDTSPAHVKPAHLQSIELIFLPPHTSRNMQSQNKGIVYFLKWKYRELMLKKIILHYETSDNTKQFVWTLLDALHNLKRSWDRLSPLTIHNCFTETGLSLPKTDIAVKEGSLDTKMQQQNYRSLFQRVSTHIPVDMSVDDYINVDKHVVTWDQMGLVSKIISNTFSTPDFMDIQQNGVTSDDCNISDEATPSSTGLAALESSDGLLEMACCEEPLPNMQNGIHPSPTPVDLQVSSPSPIHVNGCNDNLPDSDNQSCEMTSPGTPNCVSIRNSTSTSPVQPSPFSPMLDRVSLGNTTITSNGPSPAFNSFMVQDVSFSSSKSNSNNLSTLETHPSLVSSLSTLKTEATLAENLEMTKLLCKNQNTIKVEDKEPEVPFVPPTLHEANDGLILLRKFVELNAASMGEAVDMFDCLNHLEDFVEKQAIIASRQTSILDFYSRR